MAEHCKKCGTELLAGQRYCRLCGTPISESQREELPTKIFPGERAGASAPANTAPQSRPGTDPFSPFQATASQPPVASPQQTTPLYMPPDQASPHGKTISFLLLGLLGVALLGVLLFFWAARQTVPDRRVPTPPQTEGGVPVPPAPPAPPAQPGAMLDESGAVETANETVITKQYTLGSNATLAIKGINSHVSIEGWDEPNAEVKIIKRGSIEERRAARIMSSNNNDRLSFETSPMGSNSIDIRYEVKLPRALRNVEINTINAEVKLSELAGGVSVTSQNGSVDLDDVSGTTTIKLTNGQIRASYENANLKGPQELSTVNGKIEVTLGDGIDAELDAQTVAGNIEVDEDFGIKVEKKIVGQEASGRIGAGGQPLSIETVNGPITISK